MARKQPVQLPPPVQRIRLQYTKLDAARYASHRDLSRALERALRRAQVPMAFSSGFSRHPRISYAGAAPTGTGSTAEYVELGLASIVDPGLLMEALNEVTPPGVRVVRAVEASSVKLPQLLQASVWTIELPGLSADQIARVVEVARAPGLSTVRPGKKGDREVDVSAALVQVEGREQGIEVVLRHTEPLVRPEDLCHALAERLPEVMGQVPAPRATRSAQGPLVDGKVADPLV